MRQSTIALPVECAGAGLHSGRTARLRLLPAPPDSGIVFVRAASTRNDLGVDATGHARALPEEPAHGGFEVPARIRSVYSSSRATNLALAVDGVPLEASRIATVEHLLASLYACEIDNVRVEIEGPEVPAFDGSAAPLFGLIRSAGRLEQAADCSVLALEEPIEIRDGERWIRADPHPSGLRISYAIDFEHALIGRQTLELPRLDATSFESELAHARTFGFEGEVEALRSSGLGLGGSLENTIVLGASGILNEGGLRYADEFVRHKVIDLVGDLALLGARLQAHVQVERGGHALHHRLVRAMVERQGETRCARGVETSATSPRRGTDVYST